MATALWRSALSFLAGGGSTRNKGQQISGPGAYSSSSASPVTQDSALQLSAVWACVRLLTETISSMPINVYKINKDGSRTLDPNHYLARLFNGKMNRWQTKQECLETILYQYVMQGNGFAAIQRNVVKEVVAIVPLMTPQMQVELLGTGAIEYRYQETQGLRIYAESSVWHNKLFGNGIIGLSPLAYARNSIGVGQATEQAVTNIYMNGGKASGLLMIDHVLKQDQREAIKKNFSEMQEGQSQRLFILEADMKYQQVSLSPTDIQLLDSRRFQIEDICRFYGVPSVLVNDTTQNTAWGSGIKQIVEGFYKFGLRPYLERIEASMKCNLLQPEEWATVDIEFDFSALLRPDFYERLKAGKDGVQGGLIVSNEWRANEGLKPLPGGDKLLVQKQMVPLESVGTVTEGKQQNAPEKA